MKKNNEWAVTLDMWKEGDGEETTEVYTNLSQKLGTFLWEKFGNCEFIEDSCDGEEYAVRFKIFSNERPDLKDFVSKPISVDNSIWQVIESEIGEFKEVYIDEHFKDLSDYYGQNRNPFEDLTFKLIGEVINCYKEGLYDAVVILCRSAVDSSVYLACVWTRNKVDKDKYEYRSPKPFEPGAEVSWGKLKDESIRLGFLSNNVLNDIEEVREMGNFAAHIGERQLKEMTKWSKKNRVLIRNILQKGVKVLNVLPRDYPKGYKLYTSKNEAYYAIDMTVDFLKKLSAGYNQSN